MKILCLTQQFPLPPDRGMAIRVAGMLRALAASHDVHLLVPRQAKTAESLVLELEDTLGISAEVFPWSVCPEARVGAARLWAGSIARRTPPWVLAGFNPQLQRRAQAIAPRFDAIVILDDYAGAYAPAIRRSGTAPPIVADKPEVLAAFASEKPTGNRPKERGRDRLGRLLTRAFERRYLHYVDAVVVSSDEEAGRFERLYGQAPAVVPSAIDLPRITRQIGNASAGGSPLSVGWIGSLDGEPIVEGLKRFVESAWQPLGLDGFRLLIAGRDPPPSVQALQGFAGVTLLGYVDELDSFLGSLDAAVVPLWAGRGIKLKTLTLLGAGLPVAATTVALEGIPAVDGRHCLIADDAAGLADGLRRIASEPELAGRLGKEGGGLVAERFSWKTVGPQFVETVEHAVSAARADWRHGY